MGRFTYFPSKKVYIFIRCAYDYEYSWQTLRIELPAYNYQATLTRINRKNA